MFPTLRLPHSKTEYEFAIPILYFDAFVSRVKALWGVCINACFVGLKSLSVSLSNATVILNTNITYLYRFGVIINDP